MNIEDTKCKFAQSVVFLGVPMHQEKWGMSPPRKPLPDIGIGMDPIQVNGKDEGVDFALAYFPIGTTLSKNVQSLSFTFHTPERVAEFLRLMQRALNCNEPDNTPDWALGLMDFVTGTPTQPKVQNRPMPPSNEPSGPLAPGAVVSTLEVPDEDDWQLGVPEATERKEA